MKKLAICLNLDQATLKNLESVEFKNYIKDFDEIHLLHGFQVHLYVNELTPYFYPAQDDYDAIKSSTLKLLEQVSEKLLPDSSCKKDVHCFIDSSPANRICEFIDDNGINTCVTFTTKKEGIQGIFSTHFTEHVLRHSNANIFAFKF